MTKLSRKHLKTLNDQFTGTFTVFCLSCLSMVFLYNSEKIIPRFDYTITRFANNKDSSIIQLGQFQQKFNTEGEEKIFQLAIKSQDGVFNKLFLEKLHLLTIEIQQLYGVQKIYSPTNATKLVTSETGIKPHPLLDLSSQDQLLRDSIFFSHSEEFKAMFYSTSGKSFLLSIFPIYILSDKEYRQLSNSIDSLTKLHFDNQYHLFSPSNLMATYTEDLIQSSIQISIIALFIVLTLLYFVYRKLTALIIPLFIALFISVFIYCINQYRGGNIDLLSIVLPLIYGMVTASNTFFFRSYYSTYRLNNHLVNRIPTYLEFKEVGLRVLYANLLTAIGFISLSLFNIKSLTEFGIYAATGILLSYLLSFSFLRNEDFTSDTFSKNKEWFQRISHNFLNGVLKNEMIISVSYIVLLFGAILCFQKIKQNGNLIEELNSSHKQKESYLYYDQEFGGTRRFNMVLYLTSPKSNWYNIALLRQLDSLTQNIAVCYSLHQIVSPVLMIKAANKSIQGSDPLAFKLPYSDTGLVQCLNLIQSTLYGEELSRFISEDGTWIRISSNMKNPDLSSIQNMHNNFERHFASSGLNGICNFFITGESHVLDQMAIRLTKSIWEGIIIILALVALLTWGLMRNAYIVIISLIVNLTPLIFISGLMGLFNIPLKPDTAIIFSISFGLVAESCIHIFQRYATLRETEQNPFVALEKSYTDLFYPITLNTLVLTLGFSTLWFAETISLCQIGWLISSAIFCSWITTFMLLPLLWKTFLKKVQSSV